jgi:hypothetical protein
MHGKIFINYRRGDVQVTQDGSLTTFKTRFSLISCSWTLTASHRVSTSCRSWKSKLQSVMCSSL